MTLAGYYFNFIVSMITPNLNLLMKKIICFLLPVLLAACSGKNRAPLPFSKDMLARQYFTINSTKDTSLETLHGSIIRIMAGTFSVSGEVELEIREAFTASEILAAGLTTESDGRPLISGGMIYINTVKQGVRLVKPIRVSIPNKIYDPEMQIFKGVETDSGSINWTSPAPPDSTPQSVNWELGRAIFRSKCASCHSLFSDKTGPALAHVEERGPWSNREQLKAYIRNPAAYMARSYYAQALKAKYGSLMTAFPDLEDTAMAALLGYIKNESGRPGAGLEEALYLDSLAKTQPVRTAADSISTETDLSAPCRTDTFYINPDKKDYSFLNTGGTNGPGIDTTPRTAESLESLRKGFTDPNPTNGMYDFEIRTLGWYNVDAFVEGYAGTRNVQIGVRLQTAYTTDMHVYLFCPRNKLLSVLNDSANGIFYFNKINGGIPLFLDDRAILFAFGSQGDKMLYGIREFRVQEAQTITIQVKETDEKTIREALYSRQIEGIDLGIEVKQKKIVPVYCDELNSDTSNQK